MCTKTIIEAQTHFQVFLTRGPQTYKHIHVHVHLYVPKTKAYRKNMNVRNMTLKWTLLVALASKVAILVKLLP